MLYCFLVMPLILVAFASVSVAREYELIPRYGADGNFVGWLHEPPEEMNTAPARLAFTLLCPELRRMIRDDNAHVIESYQHGDDLAISINGLPPSTKGGFTGTITYAYRDGILIDVSLGK
jgi:hypothetical protein